MQGPFRELTERVRKRGMADCVDGQAPVVEARVLTPDGAMLAGRLAPSLETGAGDGGADASDPAVRRVVYNLYRNLLGNYNDKANDIVAAAPAERVRHDQGITKQVESMM